MIEWTGKPSNEEPCHFWDPLSKDLDSWTSDAAAKFLSPLNPAYPNRSFLISQVPQEFISSKNSKSWNAFASTNRLLFPGSPLCSIPRLTFLDFPTYIRIYIYISYIYIYISCVYIYIYIYIYISRSILRGPVAGKQLDDAVFVRLYYIWSILDNSRITVLCYRWTGTSPKTHFRDFFADHSYLDFPSLTATTAKSRFKIATKNNHYFWTFSNRFWTQLQMDLIWIISLSHHTSRFWTTAGVCVSYEGVDDAVDALLQRVTESPVDAVL